MSDFRFADPTWIHALWLVLAMVGLLVWFDQRGKTVLERFLSPVMQARLARRLPASRRWIRIGLIGLAAAAMVVAMMRPQWGLTYYRTPRVGAQLMICLDVSKSMLAEDTAPNRLERAKAELTDLLGFLDGDQVGLIAFAGRAAVLCPLTPDFGFFRLVLQQAGPHSVGRGGTRLAEPIEKALAGFRTESDVSRAILLVTDGEDHGSYPLDAAKAAAERGIRIIAVGFGDEAGSQIQVTDPETGVRSVLRDADGKPVVTRLDGETLRQMALITDGAYIPAGTGALDLKSIYQAHLASLVRGQLDDRGHAMRREGFQWAVLAALVLLITAAAIGSGSAAERTGPGLSHSQTRHHVAAAAVLLAMIANGTAWPTPNPCTPDLQVRRRTLDLQVRPRQCTLDLQVRRRTLDLESHRTFYLCAAQAKPAATSLAPPTSVPASPASQSPQADAAKSSTAASQPDRDPRGVYNDALALLDRDSDQAVRLLTRARREAGTDGEVRFRATYNLGWAEVKLADQQLKEDPEQALKHLRTAAGWFRDAIRLRPDHADARQNLEVVLRRILQLADSLAKKKDSGNLAERLDQVIESQRKLIGEAGALVEQLAAIDDPNAADQFRSQFHALGVQQRTILGDCQALANTAREQRDALREKKGDQQKPERQLRAAQLTNLLHYLDQASQRMGQARSQFRRRQPQRAYRRAALGLGQLKRARDQLRDPVEVLGVLLADATTLARFTAVLALSKTFSVDPSKPSPGPPAWLTTPYLEETQQSINARTAELEARLQAGLQQHGKQPLGPLAPGQKPPDPKVQRLLAMIRQAMPFITEAKEAFQAADASIHAEQLDAASQRQSEAVAALREAWERFLDLRRLIELTYAEQAQIRTLLSPEGQEAQEYSPQMLPAARQRQVKNLQRGQRLQQLIDDQLASLPEEGDKAATAAGGAAGQNAQQEAQTVQSQRQRLQLAKPLLDKARKQMTAARDRLEKLDRAPPSENADAPAPIDPKQLAEARADVDRALENLQTLRRLFFSIVEHLRETARRQAQLNDETQQLAVAAGAKTAGKSDSNRQPDATRSTTQGAKQTKESSKEDKPDEQTNQRLGPLVPRQRELHQIATQIAEALGQQAKQPPPAGPPPPEAGAGQAQQLQQMQQQASEKLAKASELVEAAGGAMKAAADHLAEGKRSLSPARTEQDQALQKLVEALALLVPPQPPPQGQKGKDQQQQKKQGQDQQKQKNKKKPQMGLDAARLLQAVRDREAQRRRQQSRRQQAPLEPVDKDW